MVMRWKWDAENVVQDLQRRLARVVEPSYASYPIRMSAEDADNFLLSLPR